MRRTKPGVVPKSKTSKYGLNAFAYEGVRINCDSVNNLGKFVDCSDAGTVACVDGRLVDSRSI